MAKARKSPQQKKELEYTKSHFTFGWTSSRNFPQTWKKKKARANRQYRRKSEEILSQAKPGIASDDVESIVFDLTAARFHKSVSRKRLHKIGTVTIGQKVKIKLERRKAAVGRHLLRDQKYDRCALSAVQTLLSLEGAQLVEFVRRADWMRNATNGAALKSVLPCKDQLDRALYFVYVVAAGSPLEVDALRRNQEVGKAFGRWVENAGRILERNPRAGETRPEQKKMVLKKSKASRSH